jgi:hypothetical protein
MQWLETSIQKVVAITGVVMSSASILLLGVEVPMVTVIGAGVGVLITVLNDLRKSHFNIADHLITLLSGLFIGLFATGLTASMLDDWLFPNDLNNTDLMRSLNGVVALFYGYAGKAIPPMIKGLALHKIKDWFSSQGQQSGGDHERS